MTGRHCLGTPQLPLATNPTQGLHNNLGARASRVHGGVRKPLVGGEGNLGLPKTQTLLGLFTHIPWAGDPPPRHRCRLCSSQGWTDVGRAPLLHPDTQKLPSWGSR